MKPWRHIRVMTPTGEAVIAVEAIGAIWAPDNEKPSRAMVFLIGVPEGLPILEATLDDLVELIGASAPLQ